VYVFSIRMCIPYCYDVGSALFRIIPVYSNRIPMSVDAHSMIHLNYELISMSFGMNIHVE